MKCNKCGAEIIRGSLFCMECGQKVNEPNQVIRICANCGATIKDGDSFCGNCGTKADETLREEIKEELVVEKVEIKEFVADKKETEIEEKAEVKEKKRAKKKDLTGIIIVVLLALVGLILLTGKKANADYIVYIKDDELQYVDASDADSITEITSDLSDDLAGDDFVYAAGYFQDYVKMSKDGRYLFYPDKVIFGEYGAINNVTLYCREIGKEGQEEIKIDSNVNQYVINDEGTLVTYVKDNKLYQHNFKEKNRVASDVSYTEYQVSPDGSKLIYLSRGTEDGNGTLYYKNNGKDVEKISSNVSQLIYINEACSFAVYMKDDSLYVKKDGKDAEKISSDVLDVIAVYETGEMYYEKYNENTVLLKDFIVNDYKGSNSDMESIEELLELEVPLGELDFSVLCYYDGEDSIVLSETVMDGGICAEENVQVGYMALELEKGSFPSIHLSEAQDIQYNIAYWIMESLFEHCSAYVCCGDVITEIPNPEELDDLVWGKKSEELYLLDVEQTLYHVNIEDAEIVNNKKIDADVYGYRISVEGDNIIYFKEKDGDIGELCINGKMIDDDVNMYEYRYDEKTNCLYYFADWDVESSLGTLKCYDGKNKTVIKDDVSFYALSSEGKVVFLYDYDGKRCKGELWCYDGKDTFKIDDDVVAIVSE